MRAKLPLLRNRSIPPARAPVLRYGVAVLSIILALIPAFLLSDVVKSRHGSALDSGECVSESGNWAAA